MVAVVGIYEVDAPRGQCARIVVKVRIAARSAEFASKSADTCVQPDLQALGVDIICELFHAEREAIGVRLR